MADTKPKEQVSYESEKKRNLPARFSVKFDMLPARLVALAN